MTSSSSMSMTMTTSTIQFDSLAMLDDHQMQNICSQLIHDHLYQELQLLMHIDHRMHAIGQSFLISEQDRSRRIPSDRIDGGYMYWYDSDHCLHRDLDLPAVMAVDRSLQQWYDHGQLHRDGNQPAHVMTGHCQQQIWYQHGQLHREGDLPAVIVKNGTLEWWIHGRRHRSGGQPAVIRFNGEKEWWVYGEMINKVDN